MPQTRPALATPLSVGISAALSKQRINLVLSLPSPSQPPHPNKNRPESVSTNNRVLFIPSFCLSPLRGTQPHPAIQQYSDIEIGTEFCYSCSVQKEKDIAPRRVVAIATGLTRC